MKLVIDGYNLLFKIFNKEPFSILEEERDYLAEMLFSYKKIKKHKIVLVFDGERADKFQIKGVSVVFTDTGVSADKYIMDYASRDRGAVVVTSDNEIINYVSSLGVNVVRSEKFAMKLEEALYSAVKGEEILEFDDYSLPGKKLKKRERKQKRIDRKL
ncbi:MAG: hypothetical protein JG762_109 [Deferribacteraceae bacterium]|nr:hypothetical protein [Deferribacteraceae bacterium]